SLRPRLCRRRQGRSHRDRNGAPGTRTVASTLKERNPAMKLDSTPAEMGIDGSKLDLLRASIEADIAAMRADGSVVIVARHGKIVMHEAIGFADRDAGRMLKTDDVMPIMSVTKQMTAAAVF